MGSSASTDTFPALLVDVAEARRAAAITKNAQAMLACQPAPPTCRNYPDSDDRRAAEDVPQALERLSEEARAAWASRLAADVAETRRASGITIAPEAALHRALQERTDELERVRRERDEATDEMIRMVRERDEARATCSELRQAVATIEAAYDRAVSERDAAHEQVATMQAGYEAALSQAVIERDAAVDEVVRLVRERDEAQAALAEARAENASLLAVVPPGTHVARVEWGVHAEVTRQRDEILRLTRERDEARASITRFAEAAAAHDANADVFVDDEYHISTRALVEEFCREHGHPLAHEWATAKINAAPDGGAPTAPDVALPCAPAAGAADPLRLSGTSRPPATWWSASDTRTRTR